MNMRRAMAMQDLLWTEDLFRERLLKKYQEMERLGFQSEEEYDKYLINKLAKALGLPSESQRDAGKEQPATIRGSGETPQKISADIALVVNDFLTLSRDDQLKTMALIQRCIAGDGDRVRDEVRRVLFDAC